MSLTSSSSSSPNTSPATTLTTTPGTTGTFRSLPQKYPQATRAASAVAQSLHEMVRKGPRSLVATVIDTSYHLSMGYVVCNTQLGVVKVYSIPYGSVVPQMRLLVRQIGPHGSNHDFVFDGFAPAVSKRGLTSGSVLYSAPVGDSGSTLGSSTIGGLPSATALNTGTGYYWHCFFYMPQLPTTSRVTLFCMTTATHTNTFCLDYLSNGTLVVRSSENNHAYTTTKAVAPHMPHYVQIQPGLGSNSFLVDGLSYFSGGGPDFWGAANTYTGYLLSFYDGSQVPPLGTWLSKVGYGTNYTGGVPVLLSTGTTIPTNDSQLPNFNASATQETIGLYLCGSAGSASLSNSATSVAGSALTLTTAYATQVAPGPY